MSHSTILRGVALAVAIWGVSLVLLVGAAPAQQLYPVPYPAYAPVVGGPYRLAPRTYGYVAYPYAVVTYPYGYAYSPFRTYRRAVRFGYPVAVPASPWLPGGVYRYSYYGYAPYVGYVRPPVLPPVAGTAVPSSPPTWPLPPPPSTQPPVQSQPPALEPIPAPPTGPTMREF